MEVLGSHIVLWAEFDSPEELDKFIEEQKPQLVRRVMEIKSGDKYMAHLEIQYKDFPMYVRN